MVLELLSKPACVQCTATKRTFDSKGAEYKTTDLTQDADALAEAKGLGYMAAPVVLVRDAVGNLVDHWSGFRPEKIAQYV
jgi:glutaredoxin-like protein NrdH